jgi:hypothetical protein
MKVYVITGADTASPIGASGEGSSTADNLTPTAYTSTVNNSRGFGVGNEWFAMGNGNASCATTPSFTPPNTSLLLAMLSSDTSPGENMASRIYDSQGQIWTLIREREFSDGSFDGYAAAYYRLIDTGASMNVTAATDFPDKSLSLKVYVITGHNHASPIGASTEGSSNTNNLTTTAYTSTVANSRGFGVANDFNALCGGGANCPTSTDVEDVYALNNIHDSISAYVAADTATPGSSVTMNFNAGGTGGAEWSWVVFEVKPAPPPAARIGGGTQLRGGVTVGQ